MSQLEPNDVLPIELQVRLTGGQYLTPDSAAYKELKKALEDDVLPQMLAVMFSRKGSGYVKVEIRNGRVTHTPMWTD